MRLTIFQLRSGRWFAPSAFSFFLIAGSVLNPIAVSAADAEELLEKGIYTEQTVGDLTEAIKVYEKVVADAKQSQNTAAQAQFRIGMCYEKQGKSSDARKAFEMVVEQYPSATQWVSQANAHLPGALELLPVPWGDGDEMLLEMKFNTGMSIGLQIYRVAKGNRDGRDVWECSTWQAFTLNGQLGKSHVIVDRETFDPIESTWVHSLLGQASAKYGENDVVIKTKNSESPTTLQRDTPSFDNEQAAEVFRRLPLKVGYKTKLDIVSPLGGAKVPIELDVVKTETVEVPAGKFECFQMKLNIGQTFWISTGEHRYIVKFTAGPATAELVKIQSPQGSQGTTIKRKRFAVQLPPNWYAYTPSSTRKNPQQTTSLLDPEGMVDSRIEAGPIETIKEDHGSAEEWLKSSLKKYRKRMPGFSLSDEGVRSIKVGGHNASVAEFEFTEDDIRKRARRIAIFGESSAVNLRYTTTADQFDASKAVMDSIVSSLTVQ